MKEIYPLVELVENQARYIEQLETHCQNLRSQCDHQQHLLSEFKAVLDDVMHLLDKKWLKDKQKSLSDPENC